MVRLMMVVLLVSLVSFGAFAQESVPEPEPDPERLDWLDDYDEALALAKATGKPMFLEYRCAP